MKSIFVKDLRKSDILTQEMFAVQSFERLQTKDGKPYIKLFLSDKTGTIQAFIWSDNIPNVEKGTLQKGVVVIIDAKAEDFKGNIQLNIMKMGKVSEQYIEDFIEGSQFSVEELTDKLNKHIDSIQNESLKKLIDKLFSDPEIKLKFTFFPAAEYIHHAFQNGLLEHVVEMLDISDSLKDYYKDADFDLIKTGIIFHDIGKIYELERVGVVMQRTAEGYLLGHLIKSYEVLLKTSEGILDDKTLLVLKHIVLSHHGQLEFGSPVKPATLEATIVYHIDVLSSQTRSLERVEKNSPIDDLGFTDFDRIVGTKVYTL